MGGFARDVRSAKTILEALKLHPNYKAPNPVEGETKTEFILRSVAHLISPPQEEGETNELECIDIAAAVMSMENELNERWNDRIYKERWGEGTWEVIADYPRSRFWVGQVFNSGDIGIETQLPFYKYPNIFKKIK